MKPIGIIGGVSWESTSEYYRLLNQAIKSRLGPKHSAELVMWSLDFEPVARLENEERWDELAALLSSVGRRLEAAGAGCLVIASNTLHRVAAQVQTNLRIPLVHIADAMAADVCRAGIKSLGLLGTRFVMEQSFFSERLTAAGIDISIPSDDERAAVHEIIFNELTLGELKQESRRAVLKIIDNLKAAGAEGVVLA
jgi:aspartate racemase